MLGLKIVKHLYIGHFAVKPLGLCKITKFIPHPSFAHPSPSIGGELVTTAASHGSPLLVGKNSGRSCGSPPLVGETYHRSFDSPPLVGAGSWQGGRGKKEYRHQTTYSHVGNKTFPRWELSSSIPYARKSYSHTSHSTRNR